VPQRTVNGKHVFANIVALSWVACVMGACVICVDLVIRYIPGKQDFRIQDSNSFLACSLSLSFGVMVCSSSTPPVACPGR
jgi:hypothetical protein